MVIFCPFVVESVAAVVVLVAAACALVSILVAAAIALDTAIAAPSRKLAPTYEFATVFCVHMLAVACGCATAP